MSLSMSRLRYARWCGPFALAGAFAALLPSAVRAQEAPPVFSPPGTAHGQPEQSGQSEVQDAPSDAGERTLPLESVLPYSRWKHHTAQKAEEALVQVRSTPAGGGAQTLQTGLVIRCDGFILVPRAVRDTAKEGGTVSVTLSAVEGGEKAAVVPTVTAAARAHVRTNPALPYALIKTNGSHVRSLPLLSRASVATGNPVRVLWFGSQNDAVSSGAGTNAAPGTAPIVVQKAVVGPVTQNRDSFSLTLGESGKPIPSGAVVVDEESGAAIGMVTGAVTEAGAQPVFMTFARFNVISSEVGLAPDRAAVRLGDRPGMLPSGGGEMVWVPGGPVALDGKAGGDFTRDYGTTTVCTPGFWIAVQPVTNGEYRRWLQAKARPLPYGWSDQELTNPVRNPNIPACGMLPEEASLYAAALQSRLPTEVEWRRAAYVRDASWVAETSAGAAQEVKDRQAFVMRLDRQLFDAAVEAQKGPLQLMEAMRQKSNGSSATRGVLIPVTPELQAAAATIQQALVDQSKTEWQWGEVGPIDAFRQDKSVFGVRNVLINAPELVQSRQNETLYAPKRYPATVDPALTRYTWYSENLEETYVVSRGPNGEDFSFFNVVARSFRSIALIGATVSTSSQWSRRMGAFWRGDRSVVMFTQANIQRFIYAGFRCAR